MKLRVKNNSLRLRLTQSEIARFQDAGRIEEAIEFGIEERERFVYALETNAVIETMRAQFENNRIVIFVPKSQADEWIGAGKVAMEIEQPIGGGNTLRLLVEKDFACLEFRAGDEDADAFPHPSEGKAC